MSHQIIIPSSGSGGDGRSAAHSASVVITWEPSHDLTPAQERRRIERADRMRLEIIEMLEAPAGDAP